MRYQGPNRRPRGGGEFIRRCPVPGLVLPGQTLDTPAPSTPACLPQPVSLDARAYVRTALPVGLLVCLCLLQAFGYRLRRVIAAFYFPKVRPPGPAHACARARAGTQLPPTPTPPRHCR